MDRKRIIRRDRDRATQSVHAEAPRQRLARSSPPLTTQELRGGLARYGALRLALGVGTYYDYKQPSSGSKPVETGRRRGEARADRACALTKPPGRR